MTRRDLAAEKADLLARFRVVREAILETAGRIEPQRATAAFVGVWDALDLLAHLIGWDAANLEAARAVLNGKLPDFYGRYDKDWATYNAELVARYRLEGLAAMIAAARASHVELITFLDGLTPEQLLKDQGVRHGNYKVIISRLIEAEARDERKHLEQMETFAGGGPAG